MFGHQRLLKAAMLALITPAAFVLVSDVRLHAATPAARPGSTHLISPKTSLPGRQRFGLFRPDRSRIKLLITCHPEGRAWRRRQRLTNASSDRSARTCRILRHR